MNKGTGTGLGIIALASTVASGLWIFSLTQGVKMLEKGDIGSACFWCGVGVFQWQVPLCFGCRWETNQSGLNASFCWWSEQSLAVRF